MNSRWFIVLKPHLLVMLVLFAGATVAGAMLLPGDAERVAMLERDGDNARALVLLERRFSGGDRSQRTLYQLEQLYQHFGKLPQARRMLELLAQSRPRDLVLQRRLVRFYRETQDGDAYLAGLSRLVTRKYSEPVCRELIAQLRLGGHYSREREAIERCRLKGYRREDDILRLAELEAVSGDKSKALGLLRNVDDVKGLTRQRERFILTSLLLDAGANSEVAKRATQWISSTRNEPFALALMQFLSQKRAQDVAMEIASSAGTPGDAISLSVAELMLDRDQTSAARAYLRGWIERSEVQDPDLAERFIRLALDAEDPEVALLAARRTGLQRIPEPALVAVAEALGAVGRRDEFEIVRAALSADTIVAHPLLSAMVELNKGETQATRQLLDTVSSEALDTWRLALWARLMRETGDGAAAEAKLRAMGIAGQPSLATAGQPVTRRATRALRSYRARVARQRMDERKAVKLTGTVTNRAAKRWVGVQSSKFKGNVNVSKRRKPAVRPVALDENPPP